MNKQFFMRIKCISCDDVLEFTQYKQFKTCKCFDESSGKTGFGYDVGNGHYSRVVGNINHMLELEDYE